MAFSISFAHSKRLILILALLAAVSPALGWEDDVRQIDLEPKDAERDRTVPVRVYLTEQKEPQPIILFSHGLGGSRKNSQYLGSAWAKEGYVCVFMQHAGSDEDVWKSERLLNRMTALKAAASFENMNARNADVSFVIDELTRWNDDKDHPLYHKLNLEKIGMSGHSFGAVTTMAVAGRKFPLRRNYADKRIDAFLAMSPQIANGMTPERTFGELQSPILCMTGTEDASPIDPGVKPEDRQKVYAALPPKDKYHLVFEGGRHHTFGEVDGRLSTRNRDPKHHPTIVKISQHFWDAYLKDDAEAKAWLQSKQPRIDCEMKDGDVWEWK